MAWNELWLEQPQGREIDAGEVAGPSVGSGALHLCAGQQKATERTAQFGKLCWFFSEIHRIQLAYRKGKAVDRCAAVVCDMKQPSL